MKKTIQVTRPGSFRAAFRGLVTVFRSESNFRIHLSVFVIVIAAAILLHIPAEKWLILILVSGLVFVSECFNSAIEYLADRITGEHDEMIRRAKDVAAAGVLISAFVAAVAGLIIFIPEIPGLLDSLK